MRTRHVANLRRRRELAVLAASRLASVLLSLACLGMPSRAQGPTFEVRFTEAARPQRFTGRVLVSLTKSGTEPRTSSTWARLDPVIGADFGDVGPDEPMLLDRSSAMSFPVPLADLEGGRYLAQAVL